MAKHPHKDKPSFMIIQCPECSTRYNLTAAQLGPEGRTVRCVKCGHSWFQGPEKAAPQVEEEEKRPPLPPENPATKEPVESILKRTRTQLKRRVVLAGAGTFVGLLLIFSVLVLLRDAVIKVMPAMAGFYQVIGLAEDTQTAKGATVSNAGLVIPPDSIEKKLVEDGQLTTFTFHGEVINRNTEEVVVPEIRVTLLDEKGVALDFWPAQVEKTTLAPGEKTTWVCRFFNPPLARVSEHKVTFVENAD